MENGKRDSSWRDLKITSYDGLELHARYYPAQGKVKGLPVLCLPGLTRNAKDFHVLAEALSSAEANPRDVYCLDFRGRGLSANDPEKKYNPKTELRDVLDFLASQFLHKVNVIGTSRGGVIAMLLASAQPAYLNSLVLNDIGPVMEVVGLTRVVSMVSKAPFPNDWTEAADIVRKMHQAQFPTLKAEDWDRYAHRYYNEEDGLPAPHYDPHISQELVSSDLLKSSRPMWTEFQALRGTPLLVLRGENSDMLSADTLVRMGSMHPTMKTHPVPEQGHAPLLEDDETISIIKNFIDKA